MTHSPAPWRTDGSSVYDAEGGLVVSLTNSYSKSKEQKARDKADPVLITSAPDLLEACERMMSRWPTDQHDASPLYDEAVAMRAAIARARGESA